MTNEILVRHLEQLEAQLQLLAASVRTMKFMAAGEMPAPRTSTECEHPSDSRIPAPSMGKPNRFKCSSCGAWVGA